MNQDTVIDTNTPINDGGNVLDQEDVGNYIRVLLSQRNDAIDSVAVLRTKNMGLVEKLKVAKDEIAQIADIASERDNTNHELQAHIATLEAQLRSAQSSAGGEDFATSRAQVIDHANVSENRTVDHHPV